MQRKDLQKNPLPDEPGIYRFLDSNGSLLYVGKATSLRDRVASYFSSDLAESRSPAIEAMVQRAVEVTWETTESVLEALILEAALIKRHQPPFNSASKDNKSYNYLVVTREAFPRVLVVRGRELFQNWKSSDIRHVYGPFPHGGSLKEAVKLVRRIFPFRDGCTPHQGRPCFNRQLGLCPGVCSGEISQSAYAKTIRNIHELFSGKMQSLRRRLEKEMKDHAQKEQFESAEALRRQVFALKHIRDVSLIRDERRVDSGGSARIEAYDVAHTGGSETVGVMTVVEESSPQKSEYRKFIIASVTNNDPGALKEVLTRRLKHIEWTYPRVVVVDGGKAQMRVAHAALQAAGLKIPVVGVVKDEFHRPKNLLGDTKAIAAYQKDILLANNEAHSYAIKWHRSRSRRNLTN